VVVSFYWELGHTVNCYRARCNSNSNGEEMKIGSL